MAGIAPSLTSAYTLALTPEPSNFISQSLMQSSGLRVLRRFSQSVGRSGYPRPTVAASGASRPRDLDIDGIQSQPLQQRHCIHSKTPKSNKGRRITADAADTSAERSFPGSSLPLALQDTPPPWVPPLSSTKSSQPLNNQTPESASGEVSKYERPPSLAPVNATVRTGHHASARKYIPPPPYDPPLGFPSTFQTSADFLRSSPSPARDRQDNSSPRGNDYSPPRTSPRSALKAPTPVKGTRLHGPHSTPPSPKQQRAEPQFPEPQGSPEIAPEDAPFKFQYSYTETPRIAPIGFREPPYSPFGPTTMSRPWTGGPPLKKAKKGRLPRILPEFDSFCAPQLSKGAKPVDAPGPFPEGGSPRYSRTREEILGEPLTRAEVRELVADCVQGSRQVNLGRDGLIHNMLDLIHSHWKRRRVCKIKCKGVPTVDMDNVCVEVEDKTGGVLVQRAGGVLYVYRGRNYNYNLRPRFPLMLWKPHAPIYPRLIDDAPPGLSLVEANLMRHAGRKLKPFTRIEWRGRISGSLKASGAQGIHFSFPAAKNGVYFQLVPEVRRALRHPQALPLHPTGVAQSELDKVGSTGNGLRLQILGTPDGSGDTGNDVAVRGKQAATLEACLAKVDCTGLEKSDYRKIGAKLRDLVPCVLISFEKEHILVWKGPPVEAQLTSSTDDINDELGSEHVDLGDDEGFLGRMTSLTIGDKDGEDLLTRSESMDRKRREAVARFDELWEDALRIGVATPLEDEVGERKVGPNEKNVSEE